MTMRLLNTHTLRLETVWDERNVPPYAILSHRWLRQEIQYPDIIALGSETEDDSLDITASRANGIQNDDTGEAASWHKIRMTCRLAAEQGLDYAWIDTCCIDKSSSSELSEAINSMFNWYRRSEICFVYLQDVPVTYAGPETVALFEEAFQASEWFDRGWTLQELLAPTKITIYNSNWEQIGTLDQRSGLGERTLYQLVATKTRIPIDVLDGRTPLNDASISTAMKMSWASRRVTTRVEDEAYCLLGIFDVNMPMLYGEGNKAFIRLQEEIIRRSNDQTIFGWSGPEAQLLAPAPRYFEDSGSMMPSTDSGGTSSYELTNRGLRICLTVVSYWPDYYLILDCYRKRRVGELIALQLSEPHLKRSEIILANHEIQYLTSKDRLFPLKSLDQWSLNGHAYLTHHTKLEIVILREAEKRRSDDLLPIRLFVDDWRKVWKIRNCYPQNSWNLESYSTEIRLRDHGLDHRFVLALHTDMEPGVYIFLSIREWNRDRRLGSESSLNHLVRQVSLMVQEITILRGLSLLGKWLLSYYVAPVLPVGHTRVLIRVHLANADASKTNHQATISNFLTNTEE